MTDRQRELILDLEKEIQSLSGGESIKIYMTLSLVRIQHTKINTCYRMATFEPFNTDEQIRTILMAQFMDIRRELLDGKENDHGGIQEHY